MNYEKLDALIESRREEFLSDLAHWLAVPSVQGESEEGAPFGRENRRMLDLALEDARRYEAQDKARKEASGIRNEAEKLIYETEQALGRDKTISHEDKKKVKDDISALRKAVNKTKPESITTEQAAEIARLAEALKQSAKAIRTAE